MTSGALQLQDALLFVAKRADLMYNHCESGASSMLACRMAPADASDFLRDQLSDPAGALGVACHNSPEDCVIAGPTSRLIEVAERFKAKGIKHKLLNVSYGFHSSAMEAILPSLKDVASGMSIHPPSIQVGSSVLGQLLDGDEVLSPGYFISQTRQPVLFMELLRDIQSKHSDTPLQVIELGPSTSGRFSAMSKIQTVADLSSFCSELHAQGSFHESQLFVHANPAAIRVLLDNNHISSSKSLSIREGPELDWGLQRRGTPVLKATSVPAT